jgi:Protein of unknown function (DUF1579)
MKQITLTLCAVAFIIASCNNEKKTDDAKKETTSSEIKKPETGTTEPKPELDSATMMKNWQDYMTPGDVHKMMAKWDGTWTGDVSMWMVPGAPEQKSTSTAVNKMLFNGLYQQSTHSGNMMGMPFNGMSTVAYDIHKKEFVSTWIDNMGSGIMLLKGPWDEATKTITLKGTMTDPGTKADCDVRETFQIIDENTQEMKMYVMMPDGKEFNTMSIRYTRKK